MTDEYERGIEKSIEHLRDGDHDAYMVITADNDAPVFESMGGIDSDEIERDGKARLAMLAYHVESLAQDSEADPRQSAMLAVRLIEQTGGFDIERGE